MVQYFQERFLIRANYYERKNTLQKRIVTDVFSEMTNHPSAGMVYIDYIIVCEETHIF